MSKIPLLLDCTYSARGAAALAMTAALPSFELVGVTVNGGQKAAQGMLALCEALELDVPVAMGAAASMLNEPFDALNDFPAKNPKSAISAHSAWQLIYEQAQRHAGLNIVACGPLTNLATALYQMPDLPALIARLIVGGGSALGGCDTLAAERNLAADPEAAQHVLTRSGLRPALLPVDCALAPGVSAADIPANGQAAELVRSALAMEPHAIAGALAVLYTADSAGFVDDECFLGVETKGLITRGKLVTDCYSDRQMDTHNGRLVIEIEHAVIAGRLAQTFTN